MFVAKRAMTSVHPSASSAFMYRKFVSSHRNENAHDLQQNFPEKKLKKKNQELYIFVVFKMGKQPIFLDLFKPQ